MRIVKAKLIIPFLLLGLFACQDYVPKPKAYPRIIYPEKNYEAISAPCSYQFDIPTYSQLKPYTRENQPCWFDVVYTPFDATLHLSYIPVRSPEMLDSLREQAYNLVFNKGHITMAEEIVEREIRDTTKGLYGMIYDLEGKTATPFNFYLTDKDKHFFRGSFYFNQKTDIDSVAPVYDFLRKDVLRSIESFQFK